MTFGYYILSNCEIYSNWLKILAMLFFSSFFSYKDHFYTLFLMGICCKPCPSGRLAGPSHFQPGSSCRLCSRIHSWVTEDVYLLVMIKWPYYLRTDYSTSQLVCLSPYKLCKMSNKLPVPTWAQTNYKITVRSTHLPGNLSTWEGLKSFTSSYQLLDSLVHSSLPLFN